MLGTALAGIAMVKSSFKEERPVQRQNDFMEAPAYEKEARENTPSTRQSPTRHNMEDPLAYVVSRAAPRKEKTTPSPADTPAQEIQTPDRQTQDEEEGETVRPVAAGHLKTLAAPELASTSGIEDKKKEGSENGSTLPKLEGFKTRGTGNSSGAPSQRENSKTKTAATARNAAAAGSSRKAAVKMGSQQSSNAKIGYAAPNESASKTEFSAGNLTTTAASGKSSTLTAAQTILGSGDQQLNAAPASASSGSGSGAGSGATSGSGGGAPYVPAKILDIKQLNRYAMMIKFSVDMNKLLVAGVDLGSRDPGGLTGVLGALPSPGPLPAAPSTNSGVVLPRGDSSLVIDLVADNTTGKMLTNGNLQMDTTLANSLSANSPTGTATLEVDKNGLVRQGTATVGKLSNTQDGIAITSIQGPTAIQSNLPGSNISSPMNMPGSMPASFSP